MWFCFRTNGRTDIICEHTCAGSDRPGGGVKKNVPFLLHTDQNFPGGYTLPLPPLCTRMYVKLILPPGPGGSIITTSLSSQVSHKALVMWFCFLTDVRTLCVKLMTTSIIDLCLEGSFAFDTVSCISSNARDNFDWANLTAILGLGNVYNDLSHFIGAQLKTLMKFPENVPVPTHCAFHVQNSLQENILLIL